MRGVDASIVVSAAILWASSSNALAGGLHPDLRVLYQADFDGRLIAPRCDSGKAEPADYAAVVGAIASRHSRDDAAPDPIVLLGGNFAAPDVFGRSLIEGDRAAVRAFAEIIAGGGYDAVGMGHHELALPPTELDRLVVALRDRGLSLVATNLRCDAARASLCAALRPGVIFARGARQVGVLAVVSPAVMAGIPAEYRKGLSLADPVVAVGDGVKRLRQLGATDVLVMAQGPRGRGALVAVDAFASKLAAGASPDLILAGGLFDEETGRPLELAHRRGAPPIVGASPDVLDLVEVALPASGAGAPRVEVARADGTTVDSRTEALLRSLTPAYCDRYAEAISAGPIAPPLSRDAFLGYVLEVMRRASAAEIAVVNRSLAKRAAFPLSGAVTRGDLERALPYRSVLGTARLTGPAVEKTLGALLGDDRVAIAGLSRRDGSLLVNGRPLDKARSFRVATIDFVARGGDDLIAPKSFPWRPLSGGADLRSIVEGALAAGPAFASEAEVGKAERRLLVVALTDVGFDLLDTSIDNGPGYGDAQLARNEQTSLKGELTGMLALRHPRYEADGRLDFKYGWARNQAAGTPAVSGETADLITFTATYGYRGFRGARPKPYVPDPYFRLRMESELTRPAVTATQPRAFHHLEMTDTAGALFTVAMKLKLRGGGGARKELLAPGDDGRWRPVVEAGATLDPVAAATVGDLPIRLEGFADYTFVDPFGVREHQLRGSAKLTAPLLPLLFLSFGVDAFAVQRENLGWGASYDTTIGLRLHLDTAHQAL